MSRYFFLHLHKTAGISLLNRLSTQFEKTEIYPGEPEREIVGRTIEVEHVVRAFETRGDQLRLVNGHFPLCTTELLGGRFHTFTVLREPVERVLSALRHHRDALAPGEERSFEEIYDDPMQRLLICNHMTKMLALDTHEMVGGTMTDIVVDEGRLTTAKARLEGLDVVGVLARFEEFCQAMERRFDWTLGPTKELNRSTPHEPSAELVERITADNAIDIALYEHALDIAA